MIEVNSMIISRNKISNSLFIFASFFALFFVFSVIFYFSLIENKGIPQEALIVDDAIEGTFYLNQNFKQKDPYITRNPSLETMLLGPIITSLDPSKGSEKTDVNLVYFSDFRCDYCFERESDLKKIEEQYGDRVKIVWKDYPEEKKDPLSFQASLAARCAQDQDKFWEYHDLLFENNNNFGNEVFLKLAKEVNLDIDDFGKCLDEKHGRTRVRDNIIEANALGIIGIPFIYINSQEVMGDISLENLQEKIEFELSKSSDDEKN